MSNTDSTQGTVFGGLSTLAGGATSTVGSTVGAVTDTATDTVTAPFRMFEGIVLKIAVIVAVAVVLVSVL